jgi:alanyl-tRNA synthetase
VLKNTKDPVKAAKSLAEENKALQHRIDEMNRQKVVSLKSELLAGAESISGINFIAASLDIDTKSAKDLAFSLNDNTGSFFILFITTSEDKVNLSLMLSDDLVKEKGMNAGNIVRELAKEINGGGGGQPHFATAGGTNAKGIAAVLAKAKSLVLSVKC